MVKLILLRHGNTFHSDEVPYQVGAKTDLPLTEKGIAQAHAFVAYLHKKKITPHIIFAGSLKRQTQTAVIIHQAFNTATLKMPIPAFDEIDYGAWEKLTQQEIQSRWPEEYLAWDQHGIWPDTFHHSVEHHLALLTAWLKSLCSLSTGSTVVAVSSNGILRLLLRLIPGAEHATKVRTGAFCVLSLENQILSVNGWNINPLQ